MSQTRHLVRKQIYEVGIPSRHDARDLHRRIGVAHHETVVSVLEEVMREAAPGDDLVLIDRLELDLGTLRPDAMERELAERIAEGLRRALARGLDSPTGAPSRRTGTRVLDEKTADLEVLATFLSTGVLPWWAPTGTESVSLEERLARLLESSPRQLVSLLRTLPPRRTAKRLTGQFGSEPVRRVLEALAGEAAPGVRAAVDDWVARCRDDRVRRALPGTARASGREVAAAALAALIDGPADERQVSGSIAAFLVRADATTSERLAEATLTEWARGGRHDAVRRWAEERSESHSADSASTPMPDPGEEREDAPPGSPGAAGSIATEIGSRSEAAPRSPRAADAPGEPRREAPRQEADRPAGGGTTADPGPPLRPAAVSGNAGRPEAPDSGAADREAPGLPADPHEPAEAARSEASVSPDAEIGLLVENAGLVLLWPFLSRFFEAVGLVVDDAFVDDPARERAVLLLQHVVTGEADAPEHEIVLNKLLCGLPLEEPVDRSIDVTGAEAREVDELLASVLTNWSAVGSTSAGGLRQSFLRREGALARQELGWNLKVSRTGFDILLDRLPWGIGLIMLQWMEGPLVVEW